MSPSVRIRGACRALVPHARCGAGPTIQPLSMKLPRTPWYSDMASNKPRRNLRDGVAKAKSSPAPDLTGTEPPIASRAADAAEEEAVFEASESETLDDATLEQLFYGGRASSSEGNGGLTPAQEEALYRQGAIPSPEEAETMVQADDATPMGASAGETSEAISLGHKFPLPAKPYPEGFHLKKRYHPVLEQLSRLLMRDGRLSVAQRNLATVMNFLRTAPAPIYSPNFPLLPGTPPASYLPLNPVLYITVAIDSVAPLLKIKSISGAAGGGRALEIPQPLAVRTRRRIAFQWILDVVNKKPSKGSGRKQLPHRIAEEIIAVVEGRSSVWEKRRLVHKQGTVARSNIGSNVKVKRM